MDGAAVPVVTIDEHGDPRPAEVDVQRQPFADARVDAVSKAAREQSLSQ
jgi:hypothetical protein